MNYLPWHCCHHLPTSSALPLLWPCHHVPGRRWTNKRPAGTAESCCWKKPRGIVQLGGVVSLLWSRYPAASLMRSRSHRCRRTRLWNSVHAFGQWQACSGRTMTFFNLQAGKGLHSPLCWTSLFWKPLLKRPRTADKQMRALKPKRKTSYTAVIVAHTRNQMNRGTRLSGWAACGHHITYWFFSLLHDSVSSDTCSYSSEGIRI